MKSIQRLQDWTTSNEIALPGKIRTVYLKCGKESCKCKSGKDTDKHGPYTFWDRRVDGKLTSSSIPKDEIKKFKGWIKNREKLEKLVKEIQKESALVAKTSIRGKSK